MDIIKSQPKEKVDMILEPLQVLTQLAILSYLPVGTKISISNNILHLQQPTYFQGVLRWYQKDNNNKIGITTITHTLNLYKNILEQDSDELFKDEGQSSISVDDVFENITNIYHRKLLVIIHSTFEIMSKEDNEKNIQLYVEGLNKLLEPTQIAIRKWILENLTC